MRSRALYPGSFDPITSGHVDIVRRGLEIFDEIAVAQNIRKSPTFTFEERTQMICETFQGDERVITIPLSSGLLVDFAQTQGIRTVLRGLRAMSDFEYEFQLASMNRRLPLLRLLNRIRPGAKPPQPSCLLRAIHYDLR